MFFITPVFYNIVGKDAVVIFDLALIFLFVFSIIRYTYLELKIQKEQSKFDVQKKDSDFDSLSELRKKRRTWLVYSIAGLILVYLFVLGPIAMEAENSSGVPIIFLMLVFLGIPSAVFFLGSCVNFLHYVVRILKLKRKK
jgi:hypothetical protein